MSVLWVHPLQLSRQGICSFQFLPCPGTFPCGLSLFSLCRKFAYVLTFPHINNRTTLWLPLTTVLFFCFPLWSGFLRSSLFFSLTIHSSTTMNWLGDFTITVGSPLTSSPGAEFYSWWVLGSLAYSVMGALSLLSQHSPFLPLLPPPCFSAPSNTLTV